MKLNVYWYGYGGNSWLAEKLRYLIEDDLGMSLITIHEHPNADIPWNLDTVYQELQKADIIIIPANYKRQPCKSNNRVTQSMALGKPVICDPMPSYLPIIEQGVNGFITETGSESEWEKYLKILQDDSDLRETMGKKAYETSLKYSLEETSKKWVEALLSLSEKKEEKQEDDKNNLDVIIPTKNNINILHECLKSFKNSTLEEVVYIIDNGLGVEELVKSYDIPYEIKGI